MAKPGISIYAGVLPAQAIDSFWPGKYDTRTAFFEHASVWRLTHPLDISWEPIQDKPVLFRVRLEPVMLSSINDAVRKTQNYYQFHHALHGIEPAKARSRWMVEACLAFMQSEHQEEIKEAIRPYKAESVSLLDMMSRSAGHQQASLTKQLRSAGKLAGEFWEYVEQIKGSPWYKDPRTIEEIGREILAVALYQHRLKHPE